MSNIKNCPFCGGKAEVKSYTVIKFMKSITGYYVRCTECRNQSALELSITDATDKWNARKE